MKNRYVIGPDDVRRTAAEHAAEFPSPLPERLDGAVVTQEQTAPGTGESMVPIEGDTVAAPTAATNPIVKRSTRK